MSAQCPPRKTQPHTALRQATAQLRRLGAALAALICALLVSAAIVPAAWAVIPGDGGTSGPPAQAPAVRVVTAGGMSGWQITLIAVGAAVAAATVAVLLDRTLATHRAASAPNA